MRKPSVCGIMPAIVILSLAIIPATAHGAITHAFVIDTGFRPDRDGFGFANFGDPEEIAGIDLNALAGTSFHDEIFCHTGHCFGMAEASVDNYRDGKRSMGMTPAEAMPGIDRTQTGQSFYYIAEFLRPPVGEKSVNRTGEYARILARLDRGRPAVVGIYSSGKDHPGHAVVAYKIERRGEKAYIYVYDPNLPATLHDYRAEPMVAEYDCASGSFRYDNGRTFDELRLDDIDDRGISLGMMLSAGMISLMLTGIAAVLIRRIRFPRPP